MQKLPNNLSHRPDLQIPKRMGLLLCLGVHALPGSALTTFPCKFGPHFPPPWEVHVHPVQPLATQLVMVTELT